MLPNFECLIVKKPTYLSDHSQVVAWLKPQVEAEPDTNQAVFSDKLLLKLPVQFMWEKDSFNLFNLALKSADIQRQVLEFTEYKFSKSIDGVEKAVKMHLSLLNVNVSNIDENFLKTQIRSGSTKSVVLKDTKLENGRT